MHGPFYPIWHREREKEDIYNWYDVIYMWYMILQIYLYFEISGTMFCDKVSVTRMFVCSVIIIST